MSHFIRNILDGGRIHKVKYEETESYRTIKMFINNREQLLEKMLADNYCK
jgi:predicted ATPase